jgi:hypothetical protein
VIRGEPSDRLSMVQERRGESTIRRPFVGPEPRSLPRSGRISPRFRVFGSSKREKTLDAAPQFGITRPSVAREFEVFFWTSHGAPRGVRSLCARLLLSSCPCCLPAIPTSLPTRNKILYSFMRRVAWIAEDGRV